MRRRGPKQQVLSKPTREELSLLASRLSTALRDVERHRKTISQLEARVAELELEATSDYKAEAPPISLEEARQRRMIVSERIARDLEERDALLDFIFKCCPTTEANRERLEPTRRSVIKKLRIGAKRDPMFCVTCGQAMPGHISAHLFMGFYDKEDGGGLGEIFLALGREHRCGPTGGGYHLAAILCSMALQCGVPPEAIVRQMIHQRDSSGGKPYNEHGPIAGSNVSSLTDYIGRTIKETIERREESK